MKLVNLYQHQVDLVLMVFIQSLLEEVDMLLKMVIQIQEIMELPA
jgi:hypothetical protein|tara:strand:- start:473 stop:607 length:135 start_codon:yes stop_codon:yes gene_type:complete